MAPPRNQAFRVARHAGAADIGAQIVDRAAGRFSDLALEGGTAIALAAHPSATPIDEGVGNTRERRLALKRESGPFGRIGAAGTAALAQARGVRGREIEPLWSGGPVHHAAGYRLPRALRAA